jgi:hypothetical protein
MTKTEKESVCYWLAQFYDGLVANYGHKYNNNNNNFEALFSGGGMMYGFFFSSSSSYRRFC